MSSDYDGQDEAYMNLLETVEHLEVENKKLREGIPKILNHFHHSILENDSFMDLMYDLGVFEKEELE